MGGWRLAAGGCGCGWRLAAGGWRLKTGCPGRARWG